jgi:GTP-binding protein Era
VLIDARRGLDEEVSALLDRVGDVRHGRFLVLNKIDLVAKPALLALAQAANQRASFETTFMIWALRSDGVADMRRWLAERAPVGP